jgi:hypothetical protein
MSISLQFTARKSAAKRSSGIVLPLEFQQQQQSSSDHQRVSLSGVSLDQVNTTSSTSEAAAEDVVRVSVEHAGSASIGSDTSIDGYRALPVEQYGAALLRGMGWSQGQPIGKSRAGVVHTIQPKKRPGLLGLGAQLSVQATAGNSIKDRKRQLEKEKEKMTSSRKEEEDVERRKSDRDDGKRRSYRDRKRSRSRSRSRGDGEYRKRSRSRSGSRDRYRRYDRDRERDRYDDRSRRRRS